MLKRLVLALAMIAAIGACNTPTGSSSPTTIGSSPSASGLESPSDSGLESPLDSGLESIEPSESPSGS